MLLKQTKNQANTHTKLSTTFYILISSQLSTRCRALSSRTWTSSRSTSSLKRRRTSSSSAATPSCGIRTKPTRKPPTGRSWSSCRSTSSRFPKSSTRLVWNCCLNSTTKFSCVHLTHLNPQMITSKLLLTSKGKRSLFNFFAEGWHENKFEKPTCLNPQSWLCLYLNWLHPFDKFYTHLVDECVLC